MQECISRLDDQGRIWLPRHKSRDRQTDEQTNNQKSTDNNFKDKQWISNDIDSWNVKEQTNKC